MLFSTEPTDLNIIMKRICFIAQFPPPIHGLSKAVATLYSSTLQSKYLFRQVDTTNNRKILQTLWKIATHKSDLFYFTIAQTRGGNWRDLLILKLLQWKRSKCLIHLHGILSHLNRKRLRKITKKSKLSSNKPCIWYYHIR